MTVADSGVAGRTLVPGAMNFRDVGGLPATGGITRSGVLYRSGNLARLDEAGVRALGGLGLRRIIDLRADDEVLRDPSPVEGLDLEVTRVPLFLGSVESFFQRDVSLADLYRELVDQAADGIRDVVCGVVADQPVLVHCTVGKDRTGVTVALTLAAAGVEERAVIADYARTEALLPPRRNEAVLARLRAMHPDSVHLEDLTTRSPAAAMTALLAYVRDRFGSPAEYLTASGLSEDELAKLREVLVTADDQG